MSIVYGSDLLGQKRLDQKQNIYKDSNVVMSGYLAYPLKYNDVFYEHCFNLILSEDKKIREDFFLNITGLAINAGIVVVCPKDKIADLFNKRMALLIESSEEEVKSGKNLKLTDRERRRMKDMVFVDSSLGADSIIQDLKKVQKQSKVLSSPRIIFLDSALGSSVRERKSFMSDIMSKIESDFLWDNNIFIIEDETNIEIDPIKTEVIRLNKKEEKLELTGSFFNYNLEYVSDVVWCESDLVNKVRESVKSKNVKTVSEALKDFDMAGNNPYLVVNKLLSGLEHYSLEELIDLQDLYSLIENINYFIMKKMLGEVTVLRPEYMKYGFISENLAIIPHSKKKDKSLEFFLRSKQKEWGIDRIEILDFTNLAGLNRFFQEVGRSHLLSKQGKGKLKGVFGLG